MRSIDCAQLIDLAPELAVGNLCGDERAAAIAHLAECASCQDAVSSLTSVTDRLLFLAPRAEPPTAFEQRVLAALPPEPARRRRLRRPPRRWATIAAAAALALAFVAGGVLLDVGPANDPAVADAEMRTAGGEVVGQIVLRDDHPASLVMTLPGWAEQVERYGRPGDTYSVRVETSDGQTVTRPVALTDDASWAMALDVDPDTVTTVALVDGDGHVWCQAEFGAVASIR